MALCGVALAQSSMNEFDAYVADVRILQQPAVQNELGITEAQRRNMNKHAEWFDQVQQDLNAELTSNGAPETQQEVAALSQEFGEKLAPKIQEMERRVLGELTPGQLKRLREISLQAAGYAALADERVCDHIGLSEAKVQAIQTAFNEMQRKVGELRQGVAATMRQAYPEPPQTEEKAKEFRERQQKEMEKIQPQISAAGEAYIKVVEEQLSTIERAAFEALLGEKFEPESR